MPLTHDQALQQLQAWTINPSLLIHARSLEIVMRAAAAKYGDGSNEEMWGITGLLHDAVGEVYQAVCNVQSCHLPSTQASG